MTIFWGSLVVGLIAGGIIGGVLAKRSKEQALVPNEQKVS